MRPVKDPQLTNRGYLNATNNAGYQHSIKNLDCRKGRFNWSDLKGINQLNAQIPHISNSLDLSVKGPSSIFFKKNSITTLKLSDI